METPSKAVLKANMIIRSPATNRLVCCICQVEANCKDWQSHIETGRHIDTLARFDQIFDRHETNVCCKVCNCYIAWDTIKTHGKSHLIVPWYEPEDKYKIFYENHTLKFCGKYYCFLCDIIFQEWLTAYTHIAQDKHQNIMQGMKQSVPMKGSKKFYTDLITAGFVPAIDGAVKCRICGDVEVAYHLTFEHVRVREHVQSKSEFIEKLSERSENEAKTISAKRVAEASDSTESATKPEDPETSKENLLPKTGSTPGNRKMICNFHLDQEATTSDVEKIPNATATQKQAEARKIIEDPAWPDWTEEVEEIVHNTDSISSYVVSGAHPLCKEARAKLHKKKKGKKTKNIADNLDPFCLICCCDISGDSAINEHLSSEQHENSRRKYGCGNVVNVASNYFYCNSCDCTVTDFDHVYKHVIGNEHLRRVDAEGAEQDVEALAQALANIPEGMEILVEAENSLLIEPQKECCIYVVRRNAKKSFCQICDDAQLLVASKSIKEHTAGQRHKLALLRYGCNNIVARAAGYHCRCCDSEISDLENVYLHIKDKRHLSSMIKVAHKPEPQTRKRIRETLETCDYQQDTNQPSCCYLLSDYIVDKIPANAPSGVDEAARRSATDYFVGQNLYRSPNIVNRWERPIYENTFRTHSADLNASNSLRMIPNKVEAPGAPKPFAQTMTFRQPFNQRTSFVYNNNNNNIEKTNSAGSLLKLPNKVEAPRQAKPFMQQPAASSYSNIPNRVESTNNRSDSFASLNGNLPDHVSPQPQLNSMFSSLALDLSRFIELSGSRQARDTPGPRFAGRIQERENIFAVKKIHCNLCDVCVEDTMALHVHMTSHFSDEFVCSKSNGYANGAMNVHVENDRNLQNGNRMQQQVTSAPGINGNVVRGNANQPINGVQNGNNSNSNFTTAEFGPFNPPDDLHDIDEQFPTAEKNINDNAMQYHAPRKANIRNVIELLDFKADYIYELEGKLEDVELGLNLCLIVDSSKVYCLVCQKTVENTMENYFEHLCSLDHCDYLEEWEQDLELFEDVPDQYSDLALAKEYMQEKSDELVRCFVCDQEIANNDRSIKRHIGEKNHARKRSDMRMKAMKNFEIMKPRIKCDWYQVQKYWCVVCLTNTGSEVAFAKHLASRKHAKCANGPESAGKQLIFDFCAPCALLWYGYRCTYYYHAQNPTHKWHTRDGHFVCSALPSSAKSLLAAPEEFVENKVKYLEEIYEAERAKEDKLIADLENSVRLKFPRAKAYTFGSRVSGLGSPDSDIDVYLDHRNMYEGHETSRSHMLYSMTGVHDCLSKDEQSWNVEELLTNCRSPIIRAYHRATGLNCDISFQNGLSVENTKLIRTYNNVFPTCRKLILFLKQWLEDCNLSASNSISSYALYWFVIFYLQKESILPSVATLIAMSNKTRIIAGWEVSVCQKFTYNHGESNYSFTEFLTRFFKFYANFDFRHEVACPLLGEELKKRVFATPLDLPKEMALYVDYMMDSEKKPEPFRIDSAMCIQDPFDLQHNLTKAVRKVYLNRFRTCCSLSLDVLCST